MKKTDLFSSIVIAALVSPVLAQDEPDARIENRFHNIYRKYNQAPTPMEKWQEALGKTGDSNYTVQKGDTLWDVSETFFGDPNFWPKIWSVNSQIENPHEIVPKGVVQFVPGTSSEPPSMSLAKAAEVKAPEPPKEEEEGVDLMPQRPRQRQRIVEDVDLSKVQIPPPLKSHGPVAKIPASLPSYIYFRDAVKDAVVEIGPIKRADPNAPFYLQYFASDSEPASIGEVVEIESGSTAAGEGATVLIRGENLAAGMKVMAFEYLGSIKGGGGKINRVQGQLEVGPLVNSSKGIFRATVIKSLALVTTSAKLNSEDLPTATTADAGTMSPIAGEITGGQFDRDRKLFGTTSIVFLNVGAGAGVQVGTHLPVYRNPKSRIPNSLAIENPAEIGELQVVRVDNDSATAVVVRALDDIRVGDVTSGSLR